MKQAKIDDIDTKVDMHGEETVEEVVGDLIEDNIIEDDAYRKLLFHPDKQYIFNNFGK